ncbi:hypothetical protein [Thiomicrorhabdus sp.]|uniref:hypothetical protein n=1 Tax=Thiomicrorhabdus sp. TaxID=2039724 RepID=UPI0029C71FFA|nr:hypothetical protein [Thiomicrorhabdus sp.]
MLAFIGLVAFFWLVLYFYASRFEGSYLNAVTPFFVVFFPANFIIPILYLYVFDYSDELTSGVIYVYTGYLIYFFAFIFAFTHYYKLSIEPRPIIQKTQNRTMMYVFLLLSILFFLPVWASFPEYFSEPREFYKLTRDGYGIYYYSSLLFLFLYLVVSFFEKKNNIFYLLVFLFLAYFHGTKTAMVWGVLAYMMFNVYILNKKFSFKKSVISIVIFSLLMVLAFYLTKEGGRELVLVLEAIIKYSDFSFNAIKVVDGFDKYFDHFFYGQLFIEDNVYSKLPRIFWEDKPRVYGSFNLASAVYPQWFALNIGDANFGLMGRPYVDFGWFGILFIGLYGLFAGVVLRMSLQVFEKKRTPFVFVLVLFFSSLTFLPLGPVYPIIEHLFIAFFVYFMYRLRLKL